MVPQKLNLLADENVSPRVVTFLREKGGDVIDVKKKVGMALMISF